MADLGGAIGDALMVPHRSYLRILQPLLDRQLVKGLAHITGGGITDNLPRILPEGTGAAIARDGWDVPPIFQWLQRTGQVGDDEMLRAFNMGVGMIVACQARHESEVLAMLHTSGGRGATVIGAHRRGQSDGGIPVTLGVLISGRGSNLQAIIDAIAAGDLAASIAVVISNRADAAGLARAERAGIPTLVMPHKAYADRAAYDRALAQALKTRGVELVCLAGFMRLLGPAFIDEFPNAVLNIHPSLLPAFPGIDAQHQAFEHGVKVAGATVHLVTPELDAGPIVAQEAVAVRDDDTEETLAARILEVEHRLYPAAIARLTNGRWRLEGRRLVPTAGPARA